MGNFKQVVKAWRLGCDSRKSENNYDRGIALFEKYAVEDEIPF